MARVNPIGAFMRSYGLKILYFPFVATFMTIYIGYVVEDTSQYATPPTYPLYMTIWIWSLRIGGMILLLPSLCFTATYFLAKFPSVEEGPDSDMRAGFIDPRKRADPHKEPEKLGHLDCFIIRIITCGQYLELIRRNVAYHVDLVERYCTCDRLEVHVVTQSPLDGDYPIGETGQVRELLVPSTYQASSGTMHRARNLAFWTDHCPTKPEYPEKEKTWILTVDEDSFITDSFMKEFLLEFLPSGAHCSVSPSLIILPHAGGFLTAFEESIFVVLQCMGMWLECSVLKLVPLWFRGAAYVVRRDVDEAIGYQYPPELSVTDDHVFGHYFADSPFKIGYINGWNWEGAAPNLVGLIIQRGRWFRGLIYTFLYQNMSPSRRTWCVVRLILLFVVDGMCIVCAIAVTIFWWSGYLHLIVPAAPRTFPWDYLPPFAFANYFYAIVFGAWHIMSTRKAALYTVACFAWFGIVAPLTIHLAEMVWTMVSLRDDFPLIRKRFEITKKTQS